MIRIAISQAAFDAIARTMPFGSVNFESGVDANGERLYLAPARSCRPSSGPTWTGRELQRRDIAVGEGGGGATPWVRRSECRSITSGRGAKRSIARALIRSIRIRA